MNVTDIMSRPVITVVPEASVKDAARLLVQHGISALPVLDARGRLVGIVSEADLVPLQARPDPRSQATPIGPTAGTTPRTVADVMTRRVVTVRAGSEVSQAARTMLEAGIKRVPVVTAGRVVGIVSRGDLVRVIARNDDSIRSELRTRLDELGVMMRSPIRVDGGVATIDIEQRQPGRRIVESVALSVPGVLEVRFAGTPALARQR